MITALAWGTAFGVVGAGLTIWGVLDLSGEERSGTRYGWAVTSLVFGPTFLLLAFVFLGGFFVVWMMRGSM